MATFPAMAADCLPPMRPLGALACLSACVALGGCAEPRDRAYPETDTPVTLVRYEGNVLEFRAEPRVVAWPHEGLVRDAEGRPEHQLRVRVSVTIRGPGHAGFVSSGCDPARIRAYRSPARTGPLAWTFEQYTSGGCPFHSGRHTLAPGETAQPDAFRNARPSEGYREQPAYPASGSAGVGALLSVRACRAAR